MAETSSKLQKAKGKEIMEEKESESESELTADTTCGICFSDDGRSIRGLIDSCSHYFCFVCIMEWAKVETRCPMCKQRFQSIRRPAVEGIFKDDRVVDVPERNQVYDYHGHGSRAPIDPYANIMCIECRTAENEELLLLCDLCDSASHTYCVGLGLTVPEGDWYCCDCTRIRDEHSKTQTDSEGCNQNSYNSLRAIRASDMQIQTSESFSDRLFTELFVQSHVNNSEHQSPQLDSDSSNQDSETPVSIFDIISDGIVSDSHALQQQGNNDDTPQRRSTTEGRREEHLGSTENILPTTQRRGRQHVRTLRKCRNVQGRIRQIRENWNAIRSGSATFSSNHVSSKNSVFNENRKNKVHSDAARQTESLSAVNSERTLGGSASSKKKDNAGSQDVKKAWEMLEIAKLVEGGQKQIVLNHSSNLSGKGCNSKNVKEHNPLPTVSSTYNLSHRGDVGTIGVLKDQRKTPNHEKEKRNLCTERDKEHFHGGPISKYARVSPRGDMYCRRNSSTQQILDAKLSVSKGRDALNCSGSSTSSLLVDPTLSPFSEVDAHKRKLSVASPTCKTSISKNDVNCSAKEEVQSLVKLNLKLQSTKQRLAKEEVQSLFKLNLKIAKHKSAVRLVDMKFLERPLITCKQQCGIVDVEHVSLMGRPYLALGILYLGDRCHHQLTGDVTIPNDPPPVMRLTPADVCCKPIESSQFITRVQQSTYDQYWAEILIGPIMPALSHGSNVDFIGAATIAGSSTRLPHAAPPFWLPCEYDTTNC